MTERYRTPVEVHVILERGDEILLLEHRDTGPYDGWLRAPSGPLGRGRRLDLTAVRDVCGPLGVRVEPDDLRLVSVVHQREADDARVAVFFAGGLWSGEPVSACWADPLEPPRRLLPCAAAGVAAYVRGEPLATAGWSSTMG
ncbi:hypothetical protein [Actinomadura flavalba]|uniref:hypothetical protein n=1 Tax=Actinomadura flavalba TaxID=1120938 RepID=UPI000362C851|nr:hypothetical protein [Actinomadura flavalba]